MGVLIGQGTFGDVFRATFNDLGALKVCVKRIRKDVDDKRSSRVEVYALERCNDSGAGIVCFLDVFVKGLAPQAHLVLKLWEKDPAACFEKRRPTPLELRSAMRGAMTGLCFYTMRCNWFMPILSRKIF